MNHKFELGRLFGLEISAKSSALVGFIVVWIVLSAIGLFLLKLSPIESFVGGFIGACLHWLSELIHNFGHAIAAQRTGYPMSGIRFANVLGFSRYPKDEPPLPAQIHIRRALGGPAISFVVTIIALLILLAVQNGGGLAFWLAVWFFLDNLLVFSLGALLPLGFTDGSTLVKYWGRHSS
ncbi:MAG TPA: hypothetical protein VFD70_04115 [Anaerolineae bacterium]|nr:hypothetical protein [Anaerolineae bacterium]